MTWQGPPHRGVTAPTATSQQNHIDAAIDALEDAVSDTAALLWTGGKEANVLADLLLWAVGGADGSPGVAFATIDTGNHFPELYTFRDEYATPTGDRGAATVGPPFGITNRVVVTHPIVNDVLRDDDDPRGYHGAWNHDAELPDEDPIDGLPRSPEAWDVPASCGAAKVGGLRLLVEDHGFDTLITGRRGDDPLVAGGDDGFDVVEEKRDPVPHRRVNPLAEWAEANVYAYIKKESVSLPSLYTDAGYRHTDAMCCTDAEDRGGEYGEGGRDPDKMAARDRLEDMGYV